MRQNLLPHSRKYHINDNKRKTDDARTNTYSLAPPVVKKQTQSQGHRPKVHEIIPNPFPGHHKLQMRPWFLQNVKTAHNRQSSSSQSSVQQGTHFLLFRWPTYSWHLSNWLLCVRNQRSNWIKSLLYIAALLTRWGVDTSDRCAQSVITPPKWYVGLKGGWWVNKKKEQASFQYPNAGKRRSMAPT